MHGHRRHIVNVIVTFCWSGEVGTRHFLANRYTITGGLNSKDAINVRLKMRLETRESHCARRFSRVVCVFHENDRVTLRVHGQIIAETLEHSV